VNAITKEMTSRSQKNRSGDVQNDKRSGYGTVKTVPVFFNYETVKTTVAKMVPLFCGYRTVNFIVSFFYARKI